jgi:integrase
MPTTKLTDLAVRKLSARPGQGRVEHFDTLLPSFGLRITAAGTKSWVVMTHVRGRLKRVTLGRHPALGLAEARDQARKVIADAQQGRVARAAGADHTTVSDVLAEYVARHQRGKGRRSWQKVERMLARECKPWLERPIAMITRRDVIELVDRIADRGAPIMANRALASVRAMLAWAVDRGIIEASPAAGVRAPGAEVARDRVLAPGELADVWKACDGLGWPFGPIVRLLILTAQRRDEVARMAWSDLDLDRRLWTPPARADQGRPAARGAAVRPGAGGRRSPAAGRRRAAVPGEPAWRAPAGVRLQQGEGAARPAVRGGGLAAPRPAPDGGLGDGAARPPAARGRGDPQTQPGRHAGHHRDLQPPPLRGREAARARGMVPGAGAGHRPGRGGGAVRVVGGKKTARRPPRAALSSQDMVTADVACCGRRRHKIR